MCAEQDKTPLKKEQHLSRIRTIKPELFKNDTLADLGPLHQLLFIGLWGLCDGVGRTKDNPRSIKADLFPYYEANVDSLLADLESAGFITRYVAENVACLTVLTFEKHQRITGRESDTKSLLPAPPAAETSGKHQGNIGEAPRCPGREGKGREGNIPSLPREGVPSFHPLSEGPEEHSSLEEKLVGPSPLLGSAPPPKKRSTLAERFTRFYAAYPRKKKPGDAEKAFAVIAPDDALTDRMIAAIAAQRKQDAWTKDGGDFIPYPATWLRAKCWLEEVDGVTPGDASSNPYRHKPWGNLYEQAGMPSTQAAWMNFAATVDADPYQAGNVFNTKGPEAAGDWVWSQKVG